MLFGFMYLVLVGVITELKSTIYWNFLLQHSYFLLFIAISIFQALPYYESQGTYSVQLEAPVSVYVHFPYLLMAYLPLLAAGET